jgi:benzoylformate decarboxylase
MNGITTLFGNPGTTELPVMDDLAREENGAQVRYCMSLNEASVLAMADGYAQATGGCASVNLHVCPGLGNAMGML